MTTVSTNMITLAVVGAHLTGQPLNYQLQERDAYAPYPRLKTQERSLFSLLVSWYEKARS